jgi:1-deoxy-D-xylulose-5-phosphate synthase
VAVITIGPIGVTAAKAIAALTANPSPLTAKVAHYDLRFLKPLDEEMLHEIGRKFKKIVTVEDGVRNGGMGSAILEWMSEHDYTPVIKRLGLPDHFVEHGTVAQLQNIVGIDEEHIRETIQGLL